MHPFIKSLVLSALLLCSAVAQASLYTLDFSASSFGPGVFSNTTAPQSPVSGSITFSAPTLGAPATAINAINLVIHGHTYSTAEVGFGTYGDGYLFGAIANGVGVGQAGTDDFYLILSSGLNVFSYSQVGIFDTWVTRAVNASITPQVAAAVPEPAPLPLLLAGLATLVIARRRTSSADVASAAVAATATATAT